jgi:Cu+-exporting ATPase
VFAAPGYSEEEVVRIAASLERSSEHPIGAAIVTAALANDIALYPAFDFESMTGKGIRGRLDTGQFAAGNARMMADSDIDTRPWETKADELRREGHTVVFVAAEHRVAGLLVVSDPVKPAAEEAIRALQGDGLRVVMLTGDNRTTAEAVARRLGIDEVHAEVLPDQKAAVVDRLQMSGRTVAMAGDGVNDAPALAKAHVGIAMGTGADVALESADLTLLRGDLRALLRARKLSREVMKNIRQNLFFAFFYNALGVPIAAGVLYPVFGLLLSPMIASAAMTFSSVTVIANALRLRHKSL